MLKLIGEHLRSELLNVKYVVILFLDLSTSGNFLTFPLLPSVVSLLHSCHKDSVSSMASANSCQKKQQP